jgi:hypothetical protein
MWLWVGGGYRQSKQTHNQSQLGFTPPSWLFMHQTEHTVGATRLARATALARSLSNTNMDMFYKYFRLEISTDWNSAFIQQISKKKFWNLFLEVVQNSVWNYFSEISPCFFTMAAWGQQTIFKPTKHIFP